MVPLCLSRYYILTERAHNNFRNAKCESIPRSYNLYIPSTTEYIHSIHLSLIHPILNTKDASSHYPNSLVLL